MHDRPMSFTEHLGELRDRLLRSVLAVVVGFVAAYAFHEQVFGILARPVLDAMRRHGVQALQALQVTETITVYLQVSLIAGLFLASPYLLWQIWAFVAPGPDVARNTAVVPVARAMPCAMNPAPCSWRARTWWIRLRCSAS